ncbi:MAG: cyanophycin synthetase, partial [Planctomycetota bacterium]
TNLTGDHLDYHGDMDAYASAKRRLFELLAADPGGGLAVVNLDDPRGRWMAGPAGRVAGCSMSAADAAWNVRTLWAGGGGSRLVIDRIDHEGPAQLEATVELIGAHNAMNVLQSVVIADEIVRRAGVEEPEARRRMLERAMSLLTAPAGRLERVSTPSDDVVGFVDYAHTDDALEKAASALRSVMRAGSSLWLVFGCGGERDTGKRPRMGHVAARLADKIVVTSDNPRSEPPASIVRDILEGVPGPVRRGSRVHVHVDRAEAIGVAARLAAPGDVILVAGKGHETEQVIGEEVGGVTTLRTLPFDDREQLREALRARREGTRGRSAARA